MFAYKTTMFHYAEFKLVLYDHMPMLTAGQHFIKSTSLFHHCNTDFAVHGFYHIQ